jgi:hypothetical protein
MNGGVVKDFECCRLWLGRLPCLSRWQMWQSDLVIDSDHPERKPTSDIVDFIPNRHFGPRMIADNRLTV